MAAGVAGGPTTGRNRRGPPLRGAGRGHARAVGLAACHVQGQVAHDRGRRHQPAASALDVFGQLRTLTAHRAAGDAAVEVRRQGHVRTAGFFPEPGLPRPIRFRSRTHRDPDLDPDLGGLAAGLLDHLTALRRYHAAVADLL